MVRPEPRSGQRAHFKRMSLGPLIIEFGRQRPSQEESGPQSQSHFSRGRAGQKRMGHDQRRAGSLDRREPPPELGRFRRGPCWKAGLSIPRGRAAGAPRWGMQPLRLASGLSGTILQSNRRSNLRVGCHQSELTEAESERVLARLRARRRCGLQLSPFLYHHRAVVQCQSTGPESARSKRAGERYAA